MEEEKNSKAVFIGEIWSLVLLIIAMLLFINYFTGDTVTFEGKGGDEKVINSVKEASNFMERMINYLIENKKGVIIAGFIVMTILIIIIAIHAIFIHHRNKLFKIQNQDSKKKVLAYQMKFQKEQEKVQKVENKDNFKHFLSNPNSKQD